MRVLVPGAFDSRYLCTLINTKPPMVLSINAMPKLAISNSRETWNLTSVELVSVVILFMSGIVLDTLVFAVVLVLSGLSGITE